MEDKVLKIADFGFARDVHANDYYRKKKSVSDWIYFYAACIFLFSEFLMQYFDI